MHRLHIRNATVVRK